MRIFVSLLLFIFCALSAHAQNRVSSSEQWQQLPGNALDLTMNLEGQAYVVGKDGTPWRWDLKETRWRRMSGKFIRISAAEGNRPWAIDGEGTVFRYNGLWWEDKEQDVLDVSADTIGNVYILMRNGRLKKWYSLRSEWREVGYPLGLSGNERFRQITMGMNGDLWGVTSQNRIFYQQNGQWLLQPGLARAIALGGTDTRVIVDVNGLIRQWQGDEKNWGVVGGLAGVRDIAVTPNNFIWAITAEGQIWANGDVENALSEEEDTDQAQIPKAQGINAPQITVQNINASQPVASTPKASEITAKGALTTQVTGSSTDKPESVDPATLGTNAKITFVNTREEALSLAIGADGSVFGLDGAGNILRWSNSRQSFESFPGILSRIAVDPTGNPWGISALGRVFYHNGLQWKQLLNVTASDIAIGYDGSVIISNAAGELFKLNEERTRFQRIKGNGASVAVQSDGTPWVIRDDLLVQRCDVFPCQVQRQKALSIAAGPDGSIWIVSNQKRLMRLKKGASSFENVQTPGHTPLSVAVGPNGYPWVVSSQKMVLASNFFERDESDDLEVAAGTSESGTVGKGETSTVSASSIGGFTFSKNMTFESVSFTGLSAGSCPMLESDADGVMWAHNNGSNMEQYSSAKRKFAEVTTGFNSWDFKAFDVGPDDEIWAATLNPQTSLFRSLNKQRKEYPISGVSDYEDVGVAPDGSVYVVVSMSGTRYLYYKAANSSVFKKFSTYANVRKVAVGAGGDIWITGDNFQIMRWNGTRFEEPGKVTFKASNVSVSKVDGTVYAAKNATAEFYKWNATNQSFDKINNLTLDTFGVDGEGRPWLCNDTAPVIKRAKG